VPRIDTKIWEAIKARVTQAAGSLPVAWPGQPFTPPVTATGLLPFLSVGDTSTVVQVFTASDQPQQYSGILTVVHVAPMGPDHSWHVERAGALLEYFRPGCRITFQGVTLRWGNPPSVPRIDRGYRDDGYFRTPVLIPWRTT
jgi:hypothetical protein